MIRTHGLTHISLAVKDADRSSRFYRTILGAVETFREDGFIQIETPGTHDVIVFVEGAPRAGKVGGIQHFGFRLVDPRTSARRSRPSKRQAGRCSARANSARESLMSFSRTRTDTRWRSGTSPTPPPAGPRRAAEDLDRQLQCRVSMAAAMAASASPRRVRSPDLP